MAASLMGSMRISSLEQIAGKAYALLKPLLLALVAALTLTLTVPFCIYHSAHGLSPHPSLGTDVGLRESCLQNLVMPFPAT